MGFQNPVWTQTTSLQDEQGLVLKANKILMPEPPKTMSPSLSPKAPENIPNPAWPLLVALMVPHTHVCP